MQNALNVLSFWHQAEFFNSVDLKDLSQGKPGVIHYQKDELANKPLCLPWFDREIIRRAGQKYAPGKHYSYTLYLGIFKRSEYFDQAKEFLRLPYNADWDERSSDAGLTCSATVKVSHDGCLQPDTLSMSTAPWALGQVCKHNLATIKFEDFERDSRNFAEIWTALNKLADNVKDEIGVSSAFTTFELIEVFRRLSTWAGFEPKQTTASLIIKLNPLKNISGVPPSLVLSSLAQQRLEHISQELKDYLPLEETELLDDVEADSLENALDRSSSEISVEPDISILNSFFIRDIERARELIQGDKLPPDSPLKQYLASAYKRHDDLLSEEGAQLIRGQLSLDKTPVGRWPSDSAQTMSLMQQFAINTIKETLVEGGLYSVNGPPGTGKTTMLRDIIADNMARRAKVLAELSSAQAAFSADFAVKIGDHVVEGIKQLIPELRGFEMLVVSSNNTAVENITKELPQLKALGPEFVDLEYLKPVAQKLAAKHTGIKGDKPYIYALESDDDCWGLVAAALGNSENRECFVQKIQFKTIDTLTVVNPQASNYLTLVPTIKAIAEKSQNTQTHFVAAQQSYKQAEAAVDQTLQDLLRLEQLESKKLDLTKQRARLSQLHSALLHTKACTAKLRRKKVPWWAFQLRTFCYQRSLIRAFQLRIAERETLLARKKDKCQRDAKAVAKEIDACQSLALLHADVSFASQGEDNSSPAVQRKAFGHTKELNRRRGTLAAKAFELHQAWLVACYKGCFSKTVNKFNDLINGNVKNYEHAKAMWQCFFMVVPVVSSAFASVANQFSNLREGDIGWVFIDEAGQATPQQAVGALLRAQRAIVVGDPMQVEPVFTTPPEFVEFFGKKILRENFHRWSPTVASVQSVADRVNPYGTDFVADEHWLGSPLRVHRRCKDPMFSIANRIAYNNTMLHGSDYIIEDSPIIWGPSAWIDVSGEVQGKHFVPEQAEHVLKLLYDYINAYNDLPSCCMITPFRDVKNRLSGYLKREFQHGTVSKEAFRQWLNDRVGTVHTFQGKEEDIVILVLGASFQTRGAANWASSKPNLLNVAVTRARQQVYVVGCNKLWSGLNYFSVANAELKQLVGSEQLRGSKGVE